ncbi:hypothetical protein [Kribbella sp. NPDC048915]|uniref:hypothetical protein n=1 Tax=Kribbella sp. NPDC048915 TaxID=3155148 RepID=UPI0033F3D505
MTDPWVAGRVTKSTRARRRTVTLVAAPSRSSSHRHLVPNTANQITADQTTARLIHHRLIRGTAYERITPRVGGSSSV